MTPTTRGRLPDSAAATMPLPRTGSEFLVAAAPLSENAREALIVRMARAGIVPRWAQPSVRVPLTANGKTVIVTVAPDFFAVGTDEDALRVSLTPQNAALVAAAFRATLPTRKVADAVWALAGTAVGVRVPFIDRSPRAGETRNSTRLLVASDAADDAALGDQATTTRLRDGHKKYVLGGAVAVRNPGKVIIYGGHHADGSMVQGPNPSARHVASYRDYSHGTRLVATEVTLPDGAVGDFAAVSRDSAYAGVLDERWA